MHMERLDQGHFHALLEQPRLTCSGRENRTRVGGEHSSKELFELIVNNYPEHLHELATCTIINCLEFEKKSDGKN